MNEVISPNLDKAHVSSSPAVKERPILFSTEMVKAILEGRKTETRRLNDLGLINKNPNLWKDVWCAFYGDTNANSKTFGQAFTYAQAFGEDEKTQLIKCRYGNVGDLLWVRETYAKHPSEGILYKATDTAKDFISENLKWKPSIFMPREVCRIVLRITEIKVERLQSINEEDAKVEGVKCDLSLEFNQYLNYEKGIYQLPSAVESYKSLWSEINGVESWNTNPYVW